MTAIVKQQIISTKSMLCVLLLLLRRIHKFLSLMNIISKFSSATPSINQQRSPEPPSPAMSPTPKSQNNAPISWSATGLSVPGSLDTSHIELTESQLRRQALECLTSELRSLVAWSTAVNKGPDEGAGPSFFFFQAEDGIRDVTPSDSSLDRLSAPG